MCIRDRCRNSPAGCGKCRGAAVRAWKASLGTPPPAASVAANAPVAKTAVFESDAQAGAVFQSDLA
eukprot:14296775-Alexandrium_andersonii.AAC.2